MSDEDDLDAFFEEVEEVEAKVKEEEDEPLTKKLKTAAHPRPLGVVVAAAASFTTKPITSEPEIDDETEALLTKAAEVQVKAAAATIKTAPVGPSPPPVPTSHDNIDDWPDKGYRLFVGNLANEVNDVDLYEHFRRYPSLQRARIIRNPRTHSTKGFGFVLLEDPLEYARAKREMDQSWLKSRPIRIKKYLNDKKSKRKKR